MRALALEVSPFNLEVKRNVSSSCQSQVIHSIFLVKFIKLV